MEKRLILFLVLSAVIFIGWSRFFAPKVETPHLGDKAALTAPFSAPPTAVTPEIPKNASALPLTQPATQAELRQFNVKTDYWDATLSNKGGVVTAWTMNRFPDGAPVDPPKGVNLISGDLSQKIGAPFRFYIPTDPALENELNSAVYKMDNPPEGEVKINNGESKSFNFSYANNGVEATKTLTFKGEGTNSSGFDFDFVGSVKHNGAPVPAYVVIGPNFGDQSVKELSTYKHPPQISYSPIDASVKRQQSSSFKGAPSQTIASPVNWVAVDDNYFAMAFVPTQASPAIGLLTDKYLSAAVLLNDGSVNHVYAGPKDLSLLSKVSSDFGISSKSSLEDIVSYGMMDYISFLVRPIGQFMLKALRSINHVTHNFGWSIVILTIALNMLFFPLKWRSSIIMKRAAAMAPRMKDLQERMKKVDKNDPRMLDLQKEQIALMKEGNPLLGCLPLLLQMPFLFSLYTILNVSLEVRNAPFIGWIHDLSSKDPFFILPIVMCVSMIVQQALTPSPTTDPVQKKVQYLMPLILTVAFFKSAPAGLVLYWMVTNLVGVAQQYIINRLNPPNPAAATDPSGSDGPGPNSSKGGPSSKSRKGKTKEALAN